VRNTAISIFILLAIACGAANYNATDWAGTNVLTRTNLADLVSGVGLATNKPVFYTADNPTNQYRSGAVYTNAGEKGVLRGWASGTILNHTNNGASYALPVTNNFYEPNRHQRRAVEIK